METAIAAILAIRRLVIAIADRLQWLPPTLARVTVGWIFLWSGWGKLHDLDHVIEFFGLVECLYIVLLISLGVLGGGPLSVDQVLVRWATQRDDTRDARPIASLAATVR